MEPCSKPSDSLPPVPEPMSCATRRLRSRATVEQRKCRARSRRISKQLRETGENVGRSCRFRSSSASQELPRAWRPQSTNSCDHRQRRESIFGGGHHAADQLVQGDACGDGRPVHIGGWRFACSPRLDWIRRKNPLTLSGTVKDSGYENPHGFVDLETPDKVWRVVLAPPARMESRGLSKEMLKAGTKATVMGVHRTRSKRTSCEPSASPSPTRRSSCVNQLSSFSSDSRMVASAITKELTS